MLSMSMRAVVAAILLVACSGQAPGQGDYCPDGSPAKPCETVPCERCPTSPFSAEKPISPPILSPGPASPNDGDDCPQPPPMCLVFPCDPRFAKCTAFPDAECRVDCSCGFFFVDSQGQTLKCEDPDLDPVCSLPPEAGPCEAAIEQWFFNVNTGQCESFIYGGCEGNGNRFSSQEQCQNSRCGSPGGIPEPPAPDPTPTPSDTQDVCGLPKQEGSCGDISVRFHFNSASNRCEPFKFTGCGGNANNFQSLEECMQRCKLSSGGQCTPHKGGCWTSNSACCEGLRCCHPSIHYRFIRRVGAAGQPSIIGTCRAFCG